MARSLPRAALALALLVLALSPLASVAADAPSARPTPPQAGSSSDALLSTGPPGSPCRPTCGDG